MRVRNFVLQMLLLAVFSALAQAQVVVTDDANTSSFFPTTNFGQQFRPDRLLIKGMNLTVWNSCLVLAMASPGEMLCLWSSISRCKRENALVDHSCTGELLLNLLEKQAVCSATIG